MNETALRNGCNAARAIITTEVAPASVPQQAAVEDALLAFRAALKDIGDRSVYQAIAKALARATLAGCPLLTRVSKDRKTILAGRIATAFVYAHLATLPDAQAAT